MKQQLMEMISECKKAINNASQFGDTLTVQAIQNQLNVYEAKLAELEVQEINEQRLENVVEVMENALYKVPIFYINFFKKLAIFARAGVIK